MGTPVVADGYSYSYNLIVKHDAGLVVPYRDLKSMAEAITQIPYYSVEQRMVCGSAFCAEDSWRARAKTLIELLEL